MTLIEATILEQKRINGFTVMWYSTEDDCYLTFTGLSEETDSLCLSGETVPFADLMFESFEIFKAGTTVPIL